LEVLVALAVFMIVVLALISSYFGYNSRMRALRIATIGQNLAQLEMENLRSMAKPVLAALVKGVSTDVNYVNTDAMNGFPLRQDHRNNPSNVSDAFVYDSGTEWVDGFEIGLLDGTFYIPNVESIDLHEPSSLSDVPALSLPPGVVTVSVADHTTWMDYTVTLHKEVFPSYKKHIEVEDLTKGRGQLFRLNVTVYWNVGGQPKSYELVSEK
jgi:hypothetical protein